MHKRADAIQGWEEGQMIRCPSHLGANVIVPHTKFSEGIILKGSPV